MESSACWRMQDQWSDLEVYTNFRRIDLQEGEFDDDYEHETYKILFDNKALAAKLVDRKIIENYK